MLLIRSLTRKSTPQLRNNRLFNISSISFISEIKPAFETKDGTLRERFESGKPVKFENGFIQHKRKKAWEIANMDKDTFFRTKYAHVHARQLKEKKEKDDDEVKNIGFRGIEIDRSNRYKGRGNDYNNEPRKREKSGFNRYEGRDLPKDRFDGNSHTKNERKSYDNRNTRRVSTQRGYAGINKSFDRSKRDGKIDFNLNPSPVSEYIFGTNSVLAALKSPKREGGHEMLYVYGTSKKDGSKPSEQEILNLANSKKIEIKFIDSKAELNLMTNNASHNGVVLETRLLAADDIMHLGAVDQENSTYMVNVDTTGYGNFADTEKTVIRKGEKLNPLGLYLDEISDPHNMGAIIRSAYFLGVDFIVLSGKNCAPLSPVVSKTSSGAVEFIPIYTTSKPLSFFEKTRENGWIIISTTTEDLSNVNPNHTRYSKERQSLKTLKSKVVDIDTLSSTLEEAPCLITMGSEGEGIRKSLQLRSDLLTTLPSLRDKIDAEMYQENNMIVDSLNVSVASALIISKVLN